MIFYRQVILCILSVVFLYLTATAGVVDKIAIIVNEEIVTLSEFNAAFEPYVKNIEENYKGADKEKVISQTRDMFLKHFIDNILIEQEAKKSHSPIVVKDEEVMAVVKNILTKRNVSMGEYEKELVKEGKTLETVKKEIRNQMVRMRLLRREVQSKIIVSEEEIGDYYYKHRESYEGKETVHVKMILLKYPPDANGAARAKVKNDADKLRKRIENGEYFEQIAVKYSQGAAASMGGDIGFVERGIIMPEIEEVVFSLPIGKVSEPIEAGDGVYIVTVVDKKGAGLKPLDVVRQEIKTIIEEEKLNKQYDEWIASVRKKSYIDIRM